MRFEEVRLNIADGEGGGEAWSPGKFLDFRSSEIVSDEIVMVRLDSAQ